MPSLLVTPPAHLPRQPRYRASIQQPRKTDAGQWYVGAFIEAELEEHAVLNAQAGHT